MGTLDGQVAAITGAGTGIGVGIARRLAAEGASVVICAYSSFAGCEKLADEITTGGGAAIPLKLDFRQASNARAIVEAAIYEHGRLDILVNNAANDQRHEPETVTPEYWEERLRINLHHHFFAAQAVQPKMAESGGGSIINMGSCSWHMGLGFMPAYTTAKAAIEGVTVSLARAYGKDRIRVNCVIPGSVRTPRQVKEILTPEYEEFTVGQQCLPDQIEPEDISQLVLFLGSDASRMCTRGNFCMDAGSGA